MLNGSDALLAKPHECHKVECGDGARIYYIRTPDPLDRVKIEREAIKKGFRITREENRIAVMRAAIEQYFDNDDPDRARHLATIEEFARDREDNGFAQKSQAFLKLQRELEGSVVELQEMFADDETYPQACAVVAPQIFLVGWERKDGKPFRKGMDGCATKDTLRHIPLADAGWIAAAAMRLMNATEEAVGNSELPSGGQSAETE